MARLTIVDHVFAEHLAGALHDATMQLAFDDGVMNDFAAIVDRAVGRNRGHAGFRIHLDFNDVAAIGEGRTEFAVGHDRQRLLLRESGQLDAAAGFG